MMQQVKAPAIKPGKIGLIAETHTRCGTFRHTYAHTRVNTFNF